MWLALSESVVSVVRECVVSIVEEDGPRERERWNRVDELTVLTI